MVLNISFKIRWFPLIVRASVRKTSLPANLTEDIENAIYVIYVFSRAKRKLVEIRWSSLLLGSNSAFPKATQCRQTGLHETRMKRTAKKEQKIRNLLIKPSSYLQFHLLDNASRT